MKHFYFFWKSIGLSTLCVFGLLLVVGFLIPRSVYDEYGIENIMRIIIFDIFAFCFLSMWFGYLIKKIYKLVLFFLPIFCLILVLKLSIVASLSIFFVSIVASVSGFCLAK